MTTTSFTLQNLSCVSCVKLCTMKFKKLPGVADVAIDLDTGSSSVVADREVALDDLQRALAGTHYIVAPPGADREGQLLTA